MRVRSLFTVTVLAFACGFVTGCGGGSGRLSASAYRARLATISKQADKAEGAIEKGLGSVKTVPALQARLKAFATAVGAVGDEVGSLKPPKDAESANTELARGEHDAAAAARAAVPKLAKLKSPQAALAALNKNQAGVRAGREIDQALSRLKKLGYTKGS